MNCGEKELSVNVYEFLLSRMKGTLAYYGYEVDKESFWNTVTDMDGTTYDDYFCDVIKTQAMNYVIADMLFDMLELSLSTEDEKKIDDLMNAHVKNAGSRTALNEELKEFGVNYDILREIYVIEVKIELLKNEIYGESGEKLDVEQKEGYFNENYVAFKQIFFATYDYLIDTDRFGDQVYYVDEKHTAIAYDMVNGKTQKDEFGGEIKDIFENAEYYTEDGRIAYDTENGSLGYVTDSQGNRLTVELDDAEKATLFSKAQELAEEIDGDQALFEEYAAQYGEASELIYLYASSGYYASQVDAAAYFDEIADLLSGLDAGESALYNSSYGYHVICKYENESGAYDNEEYEDYFESFYSDIIVRLFDEYCSEFADNVIIDEDIWESAPSMKDVGANARY